METTCEDLQNNETPHLIENSVTDKMPKRRKIILSENDILFV